MNWQQVLNNWDVTEEDKKTKFLDKLYDFYGVTSGCYTGLFQRFKNDVFVFARLVVVEHNEPIENLFTFVAKID